MTERYQTIKIVKILTISILLLVFLGYTAYEIQRVVFGPKIYVTSPANGATLSESSVLISGTTKNINDISLDDRKIFIDENGNFKEEMILSPGYNVFAIKASDKFGRKTEKIIEITQKIESRNKEIPIS